MRRELLTSVKRVVIKVGSRVLTIEDGSLDRQVIATLCADIAALEQQGVEVVLVSSGAVAAGRAAVRVSDQSLSIPQKQAAAAIGQPLLMQAYQEACSPAGKTTAQILLTADDLADRSRFLHAKATIEALLSVGSLPIINENDSVAVAEIKFGDNDNLSALVTSLVEADLLLILTDIDGLYSANPCDDPSATLIETVDVITDAVEQMAGGSSSNVGTGGMATKVAAAKKATSFGVPTVLAAGKRPGIVRAVMQGESVGTLFLPCRQGLKRRKQWIGFGMRPKGTIVVDAGARRAVDRQGTSLLPSGIRQVSGQFERGSCVRICDEAGVEFARGVTEYGRGEIEQLIGAQSDQIEARLGYRYGDEIIHRNNLVVLPDSK